MGASELRALARAVEFAALRHDGQEREFSGEPYFNHLARVAATTARWMEEAGLHFPELVRAAYLHDVVEDGRASWDEVRAEFGEGVVQILRPLTHEKGESILTPLRAAPPGVRPWATLVKLADRRDNLRDHPNPSPEYLREARDLAHYAATLGTPDVLQKPTAELLAALARFPAPKEASNP